MKRGEQLKPLARVMREVAVRCNDEAMARRLNGAALYLETDERGEVWASNDDTRYGIALAEALWHGTAVSLAEAGVALAEELESARGDLQALLEVCEEKPAKPRPSRLEFAALEDESP